MPLETRDAAYLWDIIETAKAVNEFTAGVKPHDYLADRKLQMAVERAVEIIGEAKSGQGGGTASALKTPECDRRSAGGCSRMRRRSEMAARRDLVTRNSSRWPAAGTSGVELWLLAAAALGRSA